MAANSVVPMTLPNKQCDEAICEELGSLPPEPVESSFYNHYSKNIFDVHRRASREEGESRRMHDQRRVSTVVLAVLVASNLAIPMAGLVRSYAQLVIALSNWPGMFSGRTVLQVIGSGSPHGPYNDYAKVDDVLSLTNVVTCPGYAPGAGSLNRFDSEVITEMGPPWTQVWKTGYTTQDVIAVGGPVVSGVNRMYNTLTKSPCMWDSADWSILCKDGSRYGDPNGRHGYIAVFTDGNRPVLIVSGYSAYVTRGLGVILRNPSTYSSILQGQAVVVKLIDSNGNGIFELNETVEILKILQ